MSDGSSLWICGQSMDVVVNKGHDKVPDCWQRWEAFILLSEMLEEYGTHLVEAYRWASLFFLGVLEEHHLSQILIVRCLFLPLLY